LKVPSSSLKKVGQKSFEKLHAIAVQDTNKKIKRQKIKKIEIKVKTFCKD
jgi:hypothetical protein